MKLDKITREQIYAASMERLANYPTAASRYGTGGLSDAELKAWYDKLPMLAVDKANEIIDAINGTDGEASAILDALTTPILAAGGKTYLTLLEVLQDITDGDLATYLGLKGLAAENLQAELEALEKSLDDKVSKVDGKGLSANDYTDDEKAKVASNTNARHTHGNKTLLDTYDQANSDLTDAVAAKHRHTNKPVLDQTTAAYTEEARTKLEGIESGAQVNPEIVDNLTSTSENNPLSANQGRALKALVDSKQPAGDYATLEGGRIPESQLPSYVDDVLEYPTMTQFPSPGEAGKIYVATDTNRQYRWSGTNYVEISKSLALGETAESAYRGDRGKTAYDHSQTAGNPHGTSAYDVGALVWRGIYSNTTAYYKGDIVLYGGIVYVADTGTTGETPGTDGAPWERASATIVQSTGESETDVMSQKATSEAIAANFANLDAVFAALLDDTNTTAVFKQWWASNAASTESKYDKLSRFFRLMSLGNDQQHTVRFYSAATSSDDTGEGLDWFAGKARAPIVTGNTAPDYSTAGWNAEENRLTWYVRANALSLSDGTMNILYIEGIDDDFDLTGELAPVYAFQLAPWFRETITEDYEIRSWRATRAPGYAPFPWDVAPDGVKRNMTWHACFCGGKTSSGDKMTSGIGRIPWANTSAVQANTYVKRWDAYEGIYNDGDAKWLLYEWQHRHWYKENGGHLEGCTSYYYEYPAAIAESSTTRVVLTTSQADNFIVGSNVAVGGRAYANAYKLLSKYPLTVDGTEYTALDLDMPASRDITTATLVSTYAWPAGCTEEVYGHADGSIVAPTNSRYPVRIAGVETLVGVYELQLDPLYEVTLNADGTTFDYELYECRDSEKLSGSITADYTSLGTVLAAYPSDWQYIKALNYGNKYILFPAVFGGSSSGWYRSGFGGAAATGVRVPWRFGNLNYGGSAGLACLSSYYTPGTSSWACASRLGGSGKKRGEWVE